ncbi:MAG: hypothetical protein BRC50_03795 [Cyanobacteria bacterium SW_11_48_12]|nr:MAG: hypothetical protein BRC50_03795 [Cyanobacteria bacterium SW_11_48_12]
MSKWWFGSLTNATYALGDWAGSVWGDPWGTAEAPIRNEKKKQTDFGALNAQTQPTTLNSSPTGKSENTIDFLERLPAPPPGKQIAVVGDGATFHPSPPLRQYLDSVNQKLPSHQWQIFCFRLAPNALPSLLFQLILNHEYFDFPMLSKYGFVQK